jgi:hypothetical protein
MANQWSKPVYEEFDVNGECTAYAGAQRAETLAREPRSGELTAARSSTFTSERPAQGGSGHEPCSGAAL